MRILVLICSSIIGFSAIAQDDGLSRKENITLFNEAQRCYKAAIQAGRQITESIRCAKTSLDIGLSLFESDSKNIAGLTYNYGMALSKGAGSRDKGIYLIEQSLALFEKQYGTDSLVLVDILIGLDNTRNSIKKLSDSVVDRNYKRALKIVASNSGEDSLEYADAALSISMGLIARSYRDLGTTKKFANIAIDIYSKKLEPDSTSVTLASFHLGKIAMAGKNYKSAIKSLEQATQNPQVASYAHAYLVEAYDRTNDHDLATFHAQQLGQLTPGRENSNFMPLFVKHPTYPKTAQRNRKEGYVIVELTVSKEGLALDPVVIEEKPKGQKFGKAALKAASSLRYVPRFVDGEPEEVPGVLYKYTFKMAR
jgi:TonB family protein